MQAVALLEGTILQTRTVHAGETVGYGATWQADRETRIAVLGAGYKDGVPRALSSGNTRHAARRSSSQATAAPSSAASPWT